MTQPQNLLELQQLVRRSISDNPELFRKELIKSIKWLEPDDVYKLKYWLLDYFLDSHEHIIKEVFNIYFPVGRINDYQAA